MDKNNGRKSSKSEPEITTVVSRSGRVIKRSSKLIGFESSDLQEKDKTPTKQSKQVGKRQSSNQLNDDSNIDFLEDQQNTKSDEWSVDTKAYEKTKSSGSSVLVGEHNQQFIYAVKNLTMKEPGLVAFALWAKEVRKTLMNAYPHYSSDEINNQLKTMWKSVPNGDKSRWIQRARRLLDPDGSDDSTKNGINDTAKKQSTENINNLTDTNDVKCQTKSQPLNSTEPIDVAAHLGLLGDSLLNIGNRLKEHDGEVDINGSVSVLLDSLLCVLGPLMCLTQQVPQLNVNSQETLSKIMDDIAYIMPGL